MIPSIARGLCTGCWDCVEICPTGALTTEPVPGVRGRLCVSCGACVPACAPGAVRLAIAESI